MKANSNVKGAQALDRALVLLANLVATEGETPLAEIAHSQGLALSTAHRMIACLEANRFVVRTGRGRYRGGLALSRLAPHVDVKTTISAVARPLLRRLARKTGRIAHLGILEDDMVTYLVKETPFRSDIFTREGMQLEAYCSAIGKILLSRLSTEKLEAYLNGGNFVALTSHTLVEPRQLQAELKRVAQIAVATDDREVAENLFCVAVPVDILDCGINAAISLAAPYETSSVDDTVLEALNQTAQAIGAQLMGIHTMRD